jgi:hypothetical protein
MTNRKFSLNTFCLFFLFLFLNTNVAFAQRKGDVVFGMSIGLVSKGLLSIKYFPLDGFAIELHGGIVPGFYNYGLALHHYFDLERPNTFMQIGIANFGGMPEGIDMDSTSADTIVGLGASMWGINVGFGREFISGSDVYFFAAGPTYIINRYMSYLNTSTQEYSEKEELTSRWMGFIEGGQSYYRKKKEQ